jgi:tetratricopeptide (TPR) repeat protein
VRHEYRRYALTSAIDLTLVRIAALLERDPAAAARQAALIVREHPGHTGALLLLGTAHRACGDPQAALATFSELAAAHPGSALMRLEFGRALRAQGKSAEALAELQQAVLLNPELAAAWRELSMLYATQGDTAACDDAYARFSRLSPEGVRLNEAAVAIAHEQFAAAERSLRRALAQEPEDVAALRMLAEVAVAREDYSGAEQLLTQCLRLAPGYTRARLDLVLVLQKPLKGDPMLPLIERLLATDPGDERYRTLKADAYNVLGRNEDAREILVALADECPENPFVWVHYGHTLRALGRRDEAIAAYRKGLEIKPDFGTAWFSLANLKTFRFLPADVAAMQAQLARQDLRHDNRMHFEFALGQALESAADYATSFSHYAAANALRHAAIEYDRNSITGLVERTRALYTRDFLARRRGWGAQAADPIFIVGLPRTGSTLLEQILASHSLVEGTRELTDVIGFSLELGAQEEPGRLPTYPQPVAALTAHELGALGERYLAQTRPHRLLGRPYFID